MKVENRTHWNTRDLRAIIARVVLDETDPETRKRLRIRVQYNRQVKGSCSGHAYLGTGQRPGSATVMVPSQSIDLIDLAHVVAHEVAHSRGVTHAQMRGSPRYDRVAGSRALYAWAESMPMRRAEPKRKAKPTTDTVLALARKREREWTTRLRRATTLQRKWRNRVRDLERRVAAVQPVSEA